MKQTVNEVPKCHCTNVIDNYKLVVGRQEPTVKIGTLEPVLLLSKKHITAVELASISLRHIDPYSTSSNAETVTVFRCPAHALGGSTTIEIGAAEQ